MAKTVVNARLTTDQIRGNQRLLELADVLDNLKNGAFDMRHWFSSVRAGGRIAEYELSMADMARVSQNKLLGPRHTKTGFAYLQPNIQPEKLKECGFAACAVGWAGMHPPFVAAGFRMAAETDDWTDEVAITPAYKGMEGSYAVCEFFGLDHYHSDKQWRYLFSSDAYSRPPSPRKVAERLRQFVKRREAGGTGVSSQWIAAAWRKSNQPGGMHVYY